MKDVVHKFETAYSVSLQECLAGAGEVALQHGYELGRQAVRDGLGVIDIVSVHNKVLLAHLSQSATADECARIVKTSQDLFAECLAPFELTHRGFIDVESLNIKLEAAYRELEESIAQSRRAEEEVRQSEERYRMLFNTLIEGFCIIELVFDADDHPIDYRFLEINPAFEKQTGLHEAQGKLMRELAPDHEEHWFEIYGKIALTGEPVRFENEARALNRWYEVFAHRVGKAEDRKVAILFNDISERKQAEEALKKRTEQLEEANRELESFSYSVSHDLRAPLRAIDGYARMILKKQGDKFDEDTARRFNEIRFNTQMMGKLIDDLLDFSRLGRKNMSMSKIDMEALIGDVWKELQVITPDRNITFTVNSMPPAYGDRALIKQVYSNLLANAVKFTKYRDPALIEVGGHSDGNNVVYYVKDNGVGFDMAYYDKLFGVFQRLHNTDDFEGTGVGLATVQRIINMHGGRAWAEGKVNEGASFYFTLKTHTQREGE